MFSVMLRNLHVSKDYKDIYCFVNVTVILKNSHLKDSP